MKASGHCPGLFFARNAISERQPLYKPSEISPAALHQLARRLSISNLQFLMARNLPQKKNSNTRTWIIEGFDGPTCFFQQTLSATFLRPVSKPINTAATDDHSAAVG
jgi:hypothetical protein